MRHSNAIKNLSIAWEALSRIPDSYNLSRRVQDLLDTLLTEDETKPEPRKPTENPDDEIPF